MTIDVECHFCGSPTSVEVPEQGYKDWQKGTVIQKAMPDLSADDRELLISNTCPTCWREYITLTDMY